MGSTIAERLSREPENEITVVDLDRQHPAGDTRANGRAHGGLATLRIPRVLDHAGAGDADLVAALTGNDEVNMVACQVVHSRYREFQPGSRSRTKIARLSYTQYNGVEALFGPDGLPVDVVIAPEDLITRYVDQLIRYPGAFQVLEFSDGARAVAGRARPGRIMADWENPGGACGSQGKGPDRGRLPGRPSPNGQWSDRHRGRRRSCSSLPGPTMSGNCSERSGRNNRKSATS